MLATDGEAIDLASLSGDGAGEALAAFSFNGQRTIVERRDGVDFFVNEFWTAKQRQASSLQEISYRACFKPQLPRFFIERLTQPGEVVYDPFMGRGTTVLEAALLGRVPCGCDINPLERRPDPAAAPPAAPRRRRPAARANRLRFSATNSPRTCWSSSTRTRSAPSPRSRSICSRGGQPIRSTRWTTGFACSR